MRARVAPLLLTALTVLALSGGACSSEDPGRADPTLPPPAPTTTTATTEPDPYAIPEVIDEAYVNRVLAALDQINGDVVRQMVSTKAVEPGSVERIRAVYNDPEFQIELDGLRRLLGNGFREFKDPPGNRRTVVKRIRFAKSDCVTVEAVVDFSEVVREPTPPVVGEYELITLQRTQAGADPKGFNPTGWSVTHDEVVSPGGDRKEAPCTG